MGSIAMNTLDIDKCVQVVVCSLWTVNYAAHIWMALDQRFVFVAHLYVKICNGKIILYQRC